MHSCGPFESSYEISNSHDEMMEWENVVFSGKTGSIFRNFNENRQIAKFNTFKSYYFSPDPLFVTSEFNCLFILSYSTPRILASLDAENVFVRETIFNSPPTSLACRLLFSI